MYITVYDIVYLDIVHIKVELHTKHLQRKRYIGH